MTAADTAPNLMFSHMGLSVKNLAAMEKFYTEVMGFSVTDRGQTAGLDIVFLSRDPLDHHQIVLATGRPDELPANTLNPMFGPCINQISFRMGSLADLRAMHTRLKQIGYRDDQMMLGNHGVAWSIYFPDPESNMLEVFVDTDWYMQQPVLVPLDFSKTDAEITELTEALCRSDKGFEPIADWRVRVGRGMTPYRPAPASVPT
jgi:catechol 2,3-dioxygenase